MIVAGAVVGLLGTWLGLQHSGALATPPASDANHAQDPSPTSTAPSSSTPAAPTAPTAPASPPSPNVVISFGTTPASNATVTWGRQRLGLIKKGRALVITRPRDSGPLDVVVRAPGYLPVHTRAHTFEDNKLMVKLTPPGQKSTLLGYRAPLDAGIPFDADGGEPPDVSEVPNMSVPNMSVPAPNAPMSIPMSSGPPPPPATTP